MKRKRIFGSVVLVLLLCLAVFAGYRRHMLNRVIGLQPMQIMVDGKNYVHNGFPAVERPEGAPDGVITQVNDSTDYPDADGEANFGKVGMVYWKVGETVVVEADHCYVFQP